MATHLALTSGDPSPLVVVVLHASFLKMASRLDLRSIAAQEQHTLVFER